MTTAREPSELRVRIGSVRVVGHSTIASRRVADALADALPDALASALVDARAGDMGRDPAGPGAATVGSAREAATVIAERVRRATTAAGAATGGETAP